MGDMGGILEGYGWVCGDMERFGGDLWGFGEIWRVWGDLGGYGEVLGSI